MINMDLIIALGLVIVVVVTLIITQLGILPKKSILFLIGAVAGIFGIILFREHQINEIKKEFKKREKELKKKEDQLNDLKEKYHTSDRQLQQVRAELAKQRAAYEKTLLQIRAKNKEEKERIDGLNGDELHQEFLDAFGSI